MYLSNKHITNDTAQAMSSTFKNSKTKPDKITSGKYIYPNKRTCIVAIYE